MTILIINNKNHKEDNGLEGFLEGNSEKEIRKCSVGRQLSPLSLEGGSSLGHGRRRALVGERNSIKKEPSRQRLMRVY